MKNHLSLPLFIKLILLLIFCAVCVLPLIVIFGVTFYDDGGFSLANYGKVLSEGRQWLLLGKSLTLALGTSFLSLVMGVPLGLFVARSKSRWAVWCSYLFLVPFFIPPYIHAISWMHLLANDGPVNTFLVSWFNVNSPLFKSSGMPLAIFVLALAYHPLVTMLTIAGLRSIPSGIEESAWLAMPSNRVVKKITLPLILPYISAGAVFVFVFALANYSVPDLLLVRTYPVEVFVQFSADYNESLAMTSALPLIAMTILLIIAVKRYMGERPFIVISGRGMSGSGLSPMLSKLALLLFATVFTLAVILPVFNLFVQAHDWNIFLKAIKTAQKQIVDSIGLAVIVSLLTTIIAFFLAYWIVREQGSSGRKIEYTVYCLFSIPATIIGITLIFLWNRVETNFIYGQPMVVVMAHMTRFLPFALVICIAGLSSIDPKLEEVFSLAKGNSIKRLLAITWPLARPAIWISIVMCFILSLGEVGATLLVIPPGMETLPIRIYSLMHYGANKIVASLCLFLVMLSLLFGAILIIAGRQKWIAK